jgi:ferric iron reductase protein FhuF
VDARQENLRVRTADGLVAEVSFVAPSRPAGPGAASEVAAQLFAGHLGPVVEAVHAGTRAGLRVLWSDVAISVGAFLALSWAGPGRAARLAEAREFLAHEPRAARVVTLRIEECGGEEWMFNERHACCLAFRSTLNQQLDEPYCGNCRIPDEAYRHDRLRRAATRYAERFPTIDEARSGQDPGPEP